MRSIDRVSGSFLVILFGGVALLCGSLLFATLRGTIEIAIKYGRPAVRTALK